MTALENVMVGMHCRLHGGILRSILRTPGLRREERAARDKARDILRFVGMSRRVDDDFARNLSYGDQRRLAAARALATDPTAVLILSALFAAVSIAVLGLAVPVTASFIISWVIIGPALQTLGASPPETAMFIFYYAVLSEVTPPTALAAVAAAAITGGNTIGTMWQAWKYTLPAFLAPIAFVITDNGSHLLMQGSVWAVVWTTAVSIAAVAALAAVTGGWIAGPATRLQRLLCLPAAVLLLYLQPVSVGVGLAFLAAAVTANLITRNRSARPVGEQ